VKKRLRRLLALILVKALILTARLLPRRAGLKLFSALGRLAFSAYRKERDRAMSNVSLAFPGIDPLIVRALARGSFESLGRNALDAIRLASSSGEKVLELCTMSGEDHLKRSYESGRGIIGLTGHIGCWELLGAYLSRKGYKINVIARDLRDDRMNDILVSTRRRHGIVSIPRGASAVAGYKALKKGEILGMLLDQDIDVDGVMVPFFGVPAHTARGAALFALRSGADIVPMAIHMQPDGSHSITVRPPLEIPPDDLGEEWRIDELTASCSKAIEELIRIYPQQWVWFHDRWKRHLEGAS
jgi:KDO2-lipid IV(A) lauroyltransferase